MMKCPVCGQYEFARQDDYDVCEVCGWENDGLQEKQPDYEGGANEISLNEARKIWEQVHSWQIKEVANRRKRRGLPIFDEAGHVIMTED
jgi:hypothetical protein